MNRKLTVLATCLIAALTTTAIIAAISSAAMTLPTFSGAEVEFKGEGNEGTLTVQGGASIVCASAGTGTTGAVESPRHLGRGTIAFNNCTEGEKGEKCFSLGGTEAANNITVTGTWHLTLRTRSSVDQHFFLVLFNNIHIECPKAPVKLFLINGDVQGLITQAPGSTTAFNFTVKSTVPKSSIQEYSEFENEAGTGIKTEIVVSQEGSAKTKSGFEESTLNTIKFAGTTSIEN